MHLSDAFLFCFLLDTFLLELRLLFEPLFFFSSFPFLFLLSLCFLLIDLFFFFRDFLLLSSSLLELSSDSLSLSDSLSSSLVHSTLSMGIGRAHAFKNQLISRFWGGTGSSKPQWLAQTSLKTPQVPIDLPQTLTLPCFAIIGLLDL